MPELKNPRHEAYAKAKAEGHKGSTAARMAGYIAVNVRSTAASLNRNAAVQERIEEYKNGTAFPPEQTIEQAGEAVATKVRAKRGKVDRQYILDQLLDTAEEAGATMQWTAKLKALELVGREIGMFVERTMAIESPLAGLSPDQLLGLLAAMEQFERQQTAITITPNKSGDGIPLIAHPDTPEARPGTAQEGCTGP